MAPMATSASSLPTMGISISSAVVPVKGIVISQNVFKGEGMDIAINVSNGASAINAHFNSFSGAVGVGNLGAGQHQRHRRTGGSAPRARAPTVARRRREAISRPIPGSQARSKAEGLPLPGRGGTARREIGLRVAEEGNSCWACRRTGSQPRQLKAHATVTARMPHSSRQLPLDTAMDRGGQV